MAGASSAYASFRVSSDLPQYSDDDEFLSSASTTSDGVEEHFAENKQSAQETMMLPSRNSQERALDNFSTESSSNRFKGEDDEGSTVKPAENRSICGSEATGVKKGPLHLLDLPMDVLQVIIKEVTHTNDLTSLALTCSSLHSLAIPQMYSRFDIVWPDNASVSSHPAGVDALSYGLATLVMSEDIFHELPPPYPPAAPCPHCGCSAQHVQQPSTHETASMRRIRRGNHYAQYTRKFSVGNGPPECVQEYSVTKETGKMLGTLVALAVARMINLETFAWDMPTGVLRDVWIALSSLAGRPGHECRLERIWVRWHDNSQNAIMRSAPTASSLTLPNTQSPFTSLPAGLPRLQKYAHVEYPTLSILPPLKSLNVLDIDEPSYLEEMAILIERSRARLKELRIGISSRVYQADWLKALGGWSPVQHGAPNPLVSGWPKVGGVLGVLLGKSNNHFPSELEADQPCLNEAKSGQQDGYQEPNSVVSLAGDITSNGASSGNLVAQPVVTVSPEHSPKATGSPEVDSVASPQATEQPRPTQPSRIDDLPELSNKSLGVNSSMTSATGTNSKSDRLKLEVLELERVSLSIPVMIHTIDWSRLTALTILRCDGHEKLWKALRRQFSPSATLRSSPRSGKGDVTSEYFLRLKHIHTDAASAYLLLFIKEAIAPNTLETLFLHEAPMYDSMVQVEAIYRTVIRNHRTSLKHILVDSADRSSGGHNMGINRWRKWMFTREMISFITSGRMPRLRELSMTIHSKDWHYFLQRLPNIPQLRALHIPYITHPIHRDPRELALQILDIVTIRPEVGISYIGMQNKCYEILEGKRGEKDDFDDADDSHSEGFVPGSEDWPPSDTNDDDSDDDGAVSIMESSSELSSNDRSSSYGDDSDLESSSKSRMAFRLREILFYDDKISIFKARHGVL